MQLRGVMNKIISIFIVVFLFFGSVSLCFSQEVEKGEIINVSYQYKIAFTGMSNQDLEKGDIFKIMKNGKVVTYLKVKEASDTISKLIPFSSDELPARVSDFDKVAVGNIIVKVGKMKTKKRQYDTLISVSEDKDGDVFVVEENLRKKKRKASLAQDREFSYEKKTDLFEDHSEEDAADVAKKDGELLDYLSEVMERKKLVESDLSQNKEKLESLIRKSDVLRDENVSLAEDNEKLRIKTYELIEDKEEYQRQIDILAKKFSMLKEKLNHMKSIVNKGIAK